MKFIIASFATLCLLCSSFNGKCQNWTFKDYEKLVPPDFNPKKDFLLIETFPVNAKSNERMKEWLQKNYPGAFAVVDVNLIQGKDNQYSDLSKYRFAFVWDGWSVVESHYTNGNSFVYKHRDPMGHMLDRSTNTNYPTTKKYNNYGDYAYIPFFNSIMKNYKE